MSFKWKFDDFFIHFDKKTKGEKSFLFKVYTKVECYQKKNLGFSIWVCVFGFNWCNGLIIYYTCSAILYVLNFRIFQYYSLFTYFQAVVSALLAVLYIEKNQNKYVIFESSKMWHIQNRRTYAGASLEVRQPSICLRQILRL